MEEGAVELLVARVEDGTRLDVLMARHIDGLGRAGARRVCNDGAVQVNGRRAKKAHVVRAGDRVTVTMPANVGDPVAQPDSSVELTVRYEDAQLVVIEKPGGMASHPIRAGELGTVANGLLARYPEMGTVGYSSAEPGLVHRLDRGTSGVLLAARDTGTFDAMRALLRAGKIDKRYLALCLGEVPAPTTLEGYLDTRKTARVQPHETLRPGLRRATTKILGAHRFGAYTLVTARVSVATRHQVRAQLFAAGHPLVGDEQYGGPAFPGLARHFLHAVRIAFPHPVTGQRCCVAAPLPADLERALVAAATHVAAT